MKYWHKVALGSFVVITAGVGLFISLRGSEKPLTESHMHMSSQQTEPVSTANQSDTNSSQGRYAPYSSAAQEDSSYTQTILFFHAAWCPECRAYEQAIKNGAIPQQTQILKVDFDAAADLKKRYGVTLQSTFVAVQPNGELVKKWVGYGKQKSVETIMQSLYGN